MMHLFVYATFVLFYLYIGFVFWSDRSLKNFFFWTVLLPLTPALTLFHTKHQINIYYAFITFPIALYFLSEYAKGKLNKNTFLAGTLLSSFFIFYLVIGFFLNTNRFSVVDILKDTKPIFLLIVGFVFLDIIKNRQIEWNSRFSQRLLKLNFLATLLFFLLLNSTNLVSIATDDPYYLQQGTRYISMGTFFALFYLLAKMASNEKITIMEFVFIFGPIFMSGSRTTILIIVLLFGFNTVLSMKHPKSFLRKATFFLSGIVFLVFGVFTLNSNLRERVISLLDVELLATELAEKRFSPFFIKLESFSWYNYIVGKGLGEPFFIPWFEYRENIDNFNIYMDNIYLTLFVKYGLGFFILLFCLVFYINKTITNKRFKILVLFYFFVLGFTTSYVYQTSFLFILLLLAGFKTSDNCSPPKFRVGFLRRSGLV